MAGCKESPCYLAAVITSDCGGLALSNIVCERLQFDVSPMAALAHIFYATLSQCSLSYLSTTSTIRFIIVHTSIDQRHTLSAAYPPLGAFQKSKKPVLHYISTYGHPVIHVLQASRDPRGL
jgi:hypothetical protein